MIFAVVVLMLITMNAHADEAEVQKKVAAMIADLSGDALQHANGVTIKCSQGGTKKVTIKYEKETAKYSAFYNNCKENNSVRDAIYEIETINGVIVSDVEKRTPSGLLFDAAILNDLSAVRTQLNNKADVNYTGTMPTEGRDIDSWTPLMSAAANGNLQVVTLLVKRGALINHLNSDARNALWLATYSGHADVVKYLLKQGAYYDNSDKDNITPLMLAATNNDVAIAGSLLKYKANINRVHKDGDSALMFALANKNSKIARTLIDSGADLNIKNKFGVTALLIAVVENNAEIARYLIEKGADINSKTNLGKTALEVATAKGYTELVELLARAATSKKTTGQKHGAP